MKCEGERTHSEVGQQWKPKYGLGEMCWWGEGGCMGR